MSRPDVFDFIHSEYPYLYHYNEDISGTLEELLSSLEPLARQYAGVRQVLAKQSLSVEQKLTFIQSIVGMPEEPLYGYVVDMPEGSFNARVADALFEGDDISILKEIK